jgi:hypothetical protein
MGDRSMSGPPTTKGQDSSHQRIGPENLKERLVILGPLIPSSCSGNSLLRCCRVSWPFRVVWGGCARLNATPEYTDSVNAPHRGLPVTIILPVIAAWETAELVC